MVFHEITPQAIERAVAEWRDIDYGLVDAQETRRIVDRLFGYPVSGVLWRKVNAGLSAGRVQSPAVRLIVQRERERMAFVSAGYWDLDAAFPTDPAFSATLVALGDRRVAAGRDFDASGRLANPDVEVLDEGAAGALATALRGPEAAFTVRSVDEKPFSSRPKAPFMTSTLQQEGGRKLRLSAKQVMSVAQGLYERGYITYMRTDSTNLSETALNAARSQVARALRRGLRARQPPRLRPQGQERAGGARGDPSGRRLVPHARLPQPRALAATTCASTTSSGSAPSPPRWPTPPVAACRCASPPPRPTSTPPFAASGRTITFPGYLRAYVEGADDPEADLDDRESLLPALTEGQQLPAPELEAKGHTTSPPARYTEASLVKRLEELGIGRPSTYASIMQTIQDRGYVWKKGTALVPTWTAFAVINVLEQHFGELVDYAFTARMEDDLDEIAARHLEREPWLRDFWFGGPAVMDGVARQPPHRAQGAGRHRARSRSTPPPSTASTSASTPTGRKWWSSPVGTGPT